MEDEEHALLIDAIDNPCDSSIVSTFQPLR